MNTIPSLCSLLTWDHHGVFKLEICLLKMYSTIFLNRTFCDQWSWAGCTIYMYTIKCWSIVNATFDKIVFKIRSTKNFHAKLSFYSHYASTWFPNSIHLINIAEWHYRFKSWTFDTTQSRNINWGQSFHGEKWI